MAALARPKKNGSLAVLVIFAAWSIPYYDLFCYKRNTADKQENATCTGFRKNLVAVEAPGADKGKTQHILFWSKKGLDFVYLK